MKVDELTKRLDAVLPTGREIGYDMVTRKPMFGPQVIDPAALAGVLLDLAASATTATPADATPGGRTTTHAPIADAYRCDRPGCGTGRSCDRPGCHRYFPPKPVSDGRTFGQRIVAERLTFAHGGDRHTIIFGAGDKTVALRFADPLPTDTVAGMVGPAVAALIDAGAAEAVAAEQSRREREDAILVSACDELRQIRKLAGGAAGATAVAAVKSAVDVARADSARLFKANMTLAERSQWLEAELADQAARIRELEARVATGVKVAGDIERATDERWREAHRKAGGLGPLAPSGVAACIAAAENRGADRERQACIAVADKETVVVAHGSYPEGYRAAASRIASLIRARS